MCVDCNKETLTGVVYYSGLDFTICGNITITNGEDMNIVLSKIEQCLDFINQEIDLTGITENSPCISFSSNKLKDILQGLVNADSTFCTKIQTLEVKVAALEALVNGITQVQQKVTNITTCEVGAITKTTVGNTDTFNLNVGLVPRKTILPYFGPRTDFDSSGLGINHMKGWAISNGNNGTINACNKFIHYECDICCDVYGGSNSITLTNQQIPLLQLPELNISLSGETSENGRHTHKLRHAFDEGPNNICGDFNNNSGEDPCSADGIDPGTDVGGINVGQIGYSGAHTHTVSLTGKITGVSVGQNQPQPINYIPEHIKAFPIEFIGNC